jgi:hypothetical protein
VRGGAVPSSMQMHGSQRIVAVVTLQESAAGLDATLLDDEVVLVRSCGFWRASVGVGFVDVSALPRVRLVVPSEESTLSDCALCTA